MLQLNELKEYLNITTSDHDALLESLIDGSTSRLEKKLNIKLTSSTIENVVDWNWQDVYFLSESNITSFTDVYYRASLSDPFEAIPSDDYYVNLKEWVVYFEEYMDRWDQLYKFEYVVWGTDDDIKLAQKMIIASVYNTKWAEGISREEVEGDSVTFKNTEYPKIVNDILSNYAILNYSPV